MGDSDRDSNSRPLFPLFETGLLDLNKGIWYTSALIAKLAVSVRKCKTAKFPDVSPCRKGFVLLLLK